MNWLVRTIKQCALHEKNGAVSIVTDYGRQCLRFDCQHGDPANRCELRFPDDSHNERYRVSGEVLIPEWVELSDGAAIVLEWHGLAGSGNYITLRADDTSLIIRDLDGRDVLSTIYRKGVWVPISADYIWADGTGRYQFSLSINGASCDFSGATVRGMYMKAGLYRVRTRTAYPYTQVLWDSLVREPGNRVIVAEA